MDLPIKFPTEREKIDADVASFRALSPTERVEVIRGIMKAGELMMRRSPKAEFMRKYQLEQEELARKAFKEFVARYGG